MDRPVWELVELLIKLGIVPDSTLSDLQLQFNGLEKMMREIHFP